MFALIFNYLNTLKRPYLQNKLNIWEYRDINNNAKVSHVLEFLISTSVTFKTKFIKTTTYGHVGVVALTVITYYMLLSIYLVCC